MKFENTFIYNIHNAILGARNPLESWAKSDSFECEPCEELCSKCRFNETEHSLEDFPEEKFVIGEQDLKLMQTLIKAGSEHRKFMRQIFISVDITAPLYWWKEFDTYKVGTVSNSTSTMHKLASTPITKECFEMDDFENIESIQNDISAVWDSFIHTLEELRKAYNATKEKHYWKELIRLLPESWLQKRTITMNYENVLSMIHQRKNHKLTEWSESFIAWAKSLPYADELLFLEK